MSTEPLDNRKSRKNIPKSIQQEYEKLVKILLTKVCLLWRKTTEKWLFKKI